MVICNNLIEKIVYNLVINEAEINFLNMIPNRDEYKLDVRILKISETDKINVEYKINITKYLDKNDVIIKQGSLIIEYAIYIKYMRDEKLRELTLTKEDKIRKLLSEYLEFDSDELFKCKFNLVRIFGGAIRDIIAELKINDVDTLCGSRAINYIESVLDKNGYHYVKMLNGKDIQGIYSEIHIINEPHTWIKGEKIVQLIRPSSGLITPFSIYRKGFNDLISNVDFSCCAVSYDGEKLHEDYPNAIIHCQSKVFSVNMNAKMYSEKRALHRKEKLISRGWKEIENIKNINRDSKLSNVLKK